MYCFELVECPDARVLYRFSAENFEIYDSWITAISPVCAKFSEQVIQALKIRHMDAYQLLMLRDCAFEAAEVHAHKHNRSNSTSVIDAVLNPKKFINRKSGPPEGVQPLPTIDKKSRRSLVIENKSSWNFS